MTPLSARGKKELSELVLVEVLSRFVVGFLLFLLAMMVVYRGLGSSSLLC